MILTRRKPRLAGGMRCLCRCVLLLPEEIRCCAADGRMNHTLSPLFKPEEISLESAEFITAAAARWLKHNRADKVQI